MRTASREKLENAALWLAFVALVLSGVLVLVTRTQKEEPLQESPPYYHIIGGLEEDVGHIIEWGNP